MSSNIHHIDARMEKHRSTIPETALERSRKLKSLQVTHGKLETQIRTNTKIIKTADNDRIDAEIRQREIGQQIKELESIANTPIVTEHALLRYCERVLHIDLEQVHADILAMRSEDKVQIGNTVVTVYTDPNDHFNLAERESI